MSRFLFTTLPTDDFRITSLGGLRKIHATHKLSNTRDKFGKSKQRKRFEDDETTVPFIKGSFEPFITLNQAPKPESQYGRVNRRDIGFA